MVSVSEEIVRPLVRIVPAFGLMVAGDVERPEQTSSDHVSAFNPSSAILAALTIRNPVSAALDLGCGSGIQALLAAQHATEVTAIDLNPRAIGFTQFNASLNRLSNVAPIRGDWLDPVRGQTFDLVVANPPFVISPDTTLLFRDSDSPGDDLCRRLIEEAPNYLREGGYAQLMCDWGHVERDGWPEAIEPWIEENGCDSWVLHFGTRDPLTYAASANAPQKVADRAEFERTLDRWLTFYGELQIRALSSGAVVLRRRRAPHHWKRMGSVAVDQRASCGDHVLRLFRAQDVLARIEDEDRLLDQRVSPAERHLIDQRLSFDGEVYSVDPPTVRATSGLSIDVPIDVPTMQVLLRLRKGISLRDVIDETASMLEDGRTDLIREILPTIRRLIELGLIEVAGDTRSHGDRDELGR